MKISYAITVCNEVEEIKKLISFLFKHIRAEDEIVVLYDNKNGDPKVWQYLNLVALTADNQFNGFRIEEGEFNNNFSEWKNKLTGLCNGDVLINLDADEIPNEILINSLPEIIKNNPNTDLFWVPRINTVYGIGLSYVEKLGWNISKLEDYFEEKEFDLDNPKDLDEYNLLKKYNLIIKEDIFSKIKYYKPIINYPDYQGRIYKRDSNISWSGKVHEIIEGHKTYSYLPSIEEYALYHPKTIDRQEKQNNMYNSL